MAWTSSSIAWCRSCRNAARFASSTPAKRCAITLGLLVIRVVLDDLDASPTPVDAVTLDQAVGDLHDLDEIHLLAVGCIAGVLEDHRSAAVGEIAGPVVGAQRRLSRRPPF